MAKTKPEPGYTYDVTYGARSPQPGLTERVGDVRLAELQEAGEDITVVESYKAEGYDEHMAEARKAEAEDAKAATKAEADEG